MAVPAEPSSWPLAPRDRKSTRLNSSHSQISYAVFCLKKKKTKNSSRIAPSNYLYLLSTHLHPSTPDRRRNQGRHERALTFLCVGITTLAVCRHHPSR